MERWKGRVALVTGASSGIGRATASRLGAAGMKVALASRRRSALKEVARQVQDAGGEALVVPTDLRDVDEIAALFAAVRERWGGVDVLVNNAGLGRHAPLTTGSTEAWREMLEVNVLALCVCTREAVADMRRRGDEGHVVHVASMAAHRVPPNSGVYSATKFAVRSLTEGLRQELRELGSRIRVSAVSPGFVETEFAEVFWGDPRRAAETYGAYKVLEAGDVADAIAYILGAPAHVQVHDLLMRPTDQPS